MRFAGALVLLLIGWGSAGSPALAQSPLDDSVKAATHVLREIMTVPLKCIPDVLLHEAQGIAIVPGMVKGGFVVGMAHGKGVLVCRDDAGLWRAPTFITVSGGSVGAQAGVEEIDLVLVFRTRRSVERVLKGRVKIGADLAIAAGPLGRDASAGTEGKLKAEVLSYSRSRGLFAGVALDGAALLYDRRANAEYLRDQSPVMAQRTLHLLARLTELSSPPSVPGSIPNPGTGADPTVPMKPPMPPAPLPVSPPAPSPVIRQLPSGNR